LTAPFRIAFLVTPLRAPFFAVFLAAIAFPLYGRVDRSLV
jgi:hypothetical protein